MPRLVIIAVALALVLSTGWQVCGQPPPAETVHVSKTYNNAPFDYHIQLLEQRPGFRIYRLTYPSPVFSSLKQNNTIPAEYYLPNNVRPDDPKRPAVICLPILDGNEPLSDLVCSVLAARGIPAISFKLPYYSERGTAKGPEALADDPKLFVSAISQAGEDIRRTIDLLASRREINPERIGITGISLGGIIAATAAGAEPRLYRASLLLAGGDLLQIIHHAHETRPLSAMIKKLPAQERAEVEARIIAVDPLQFAPALHNRARDGKVLMINAAEDEVILHPCTEKLATALGINDRVTWLAGLGHYTAVAELPRALQMTAVFFAQDLPEELRLPNLLDTETISPSASALHRLVAVLQQAGDILATEPQKDRCHFADLELSASDKDGRPIEARVRFIRDAQGRFLLRCQLPQIGNVALGQGRYPWMIAGGKTLMVGTQNPVENVYALKCLEPRCLLKLRLVAAVANSIALAPEVLQRWIVVEDHNATTGGRAIRITAREKDSLPGEIGLSFHEDGRTPAAATFDVAGTKGTVRFRDWRTNAVEADSLFEPPNDLSRSEVDQAGLCHTMAMLLNMVLGQVE